MQFEIWMTEAVTVANFDGPRQPAAESPQCSPIILVERSKVRERKEVRAVLELAAETLVRERPELCL
jgi:hypothetical protein